MLLDFKDFQLNDDIVNYLLEARIHIKPNDSMVVLKSISGKSGRSKIDTFNSKEVIATHSLTASASTVFVKVKTKESDDIPMIGSGKALVTLDMYTSPDKTSKIGTINWGESEETSISAYYNHLVLGDGINWGKATSTLETAQCLGVFLKVSDIPWKTDKQKAIANIKTVLGYSQDWHKTGKDNLKNKLSTLPDHDWAVLTELVEGMNIFIDEIVGTKLKADYIIHGSIDSGYKKAEEKNVMTSIEPVKDNTSDMIICDHSATELTKAIENVTVKYISDKKGNKGVCQTDDKAGIKFIQVSLKKAHDGAQLGKTTDMMMQKYFKDQTYVDIRHSVLTGESLIFKHHYHPDYAHYIFEGRIADYLKNKWDKMKEVSKTVFGFVVKIINKAKNLARGWITDFKSVWKNESKLAIDDFGRKFGLNSKDVKTLTEAFHGGKMLLTEAKKESLNVQLKASKVEEINLFVKSIDGRIDNLSTYYASSDKWYLDSFVSKSRLRKSKIRKDFNIDVAIKLLANEVALRTLGVIFTNNSTDIDALVHEMVSIQREIYFGKTSLPLYKVYGASGVDPVAYQYLGTAADFVARKESEIKPENSSLSYPINGFSVSAQGTDIAGNRPGGKYYNIESWIITGVESGQSTYAQMRMGTNKAGAFSYVVEGTKEKTQDQYNVKFKKKKKK